jgi:hypothetical protein
VYAKHELYHRATPQPQAPSLKQPTASQLPHRQPGFRYMNPGGHTTSRPQHHPGQHSGPCHGPLGARLVQLPGAVQPTWRYTPVFLLAVAHAHSRTPCRAAF